MLLLTYERVEKMKVKCFDENTESELEGRVNAFLCTLNGDILWKGISGGLWKKALL